MVLTEDEDDDGAGTEGATVSRAEEAKASKQQSDKSHAHDLGTSAAENCQKHAKLGWPEDVSVDQFPAKFFGSLVSGFLVVAGDIFVEGSDGDHSYHAGEEEHDDDRVWEGWGRARAF